MTLHYATATRTARATAVNTAVGSNGKLKVYSGTQPADTQATATGTLLATIPCAVTTPGSVSNGVLTFTTAGMTVAAAQSGTPGWATVTTSADVRIVDMSAAITSGGDINFSAALVQTGTVTVTALTITDGTP